MNETNRSLIVLVCGIVIMLMAVLIFLTWSANTDVIDALFDAVEYLEDHNDDAGRLIVTLAALIVAVIALLAIVLELAPEDEQKELKVQQAGATTIVPAAALRERLDEALLTLPEITAARSRVRTKDQAIAVSLDLTVTPGANVGRVTQESGRVVVDTIQEDLGLPVKGTPLVRVSFGATGPEPAASSITQPPQGAESPSAPGPPATPGESGPAPDYSQFQRPDAPSSDLGRTSPPPADSPQTPDSPSESGDSRDSPQP
jgi:hypothetical protein